MNIRGNCLVSRGMRAALLLLVATGIASADPDWKGAEKVLRDHLAAHKANVVTIQSRPEKSFGTAFWVSTKDAAGKVETHFVFVRGSTVFDAPGEATVSAILKADDFLKTHTINERDLLYMLRELKALPAGLGNPITGNPDTALNPTLTFDKDTATYVLHSPRDVRTPGPSANPKAGFVRATLTIAPDYKLSWKVENIERPIK